jgi:Flp pilus assembly protein TadD
LTAAYNKKPSSELLLLSTRAQWAQKKHAPALKALRDWLKIHPKDVAVHMQLAEAYLSLNKESAAMTVYEEVLKMSPNHILALNNLAWLKRNSTPQQAMDYAQQAHQLAPKSPIVLDTLGMLTLGRGDAGEAVNLLREAADRSPNDNKIQIHLATALIQQGRTSEAQKILTSILKRAPKTQLAQEAQTLLNSVKKP